MGRLQRGGSISGLFSELMNKDKDKDSVARHPSLSKGRSSRMLVVTAATSDGAHSDASSLAPATASDGIPSRSASTVSLADRDRSADGLLPGGADAGPRHPDPDLVLPNDAAPASGALSEAGGGPNPPDKGKPPSLATRLFKRQTHQRTTSSAF